MLVAPRIVNDVSYVTRIKDETLFTCFPWENRGQPRAEWENRGGLIYCVSVFA